MRRGRTPARGVIVTMVMSMTIELLTSTTDMVFAHGSPTCWSCTMAGTAAIAIAMYADDCGC